MSQPPSFPPPVPHQDLFRPPEAHPAPFPGYDSGPMPQAPPTPPRTVTLVFVLMLDHAALGLASLLVTFTTRDRLRETLVRQMQARAARTGRVDPIDPGKIIDVAVGVGLVLGLVFLVFHLVLTFAVRRGRQWARIVTWVFAGLGALGLLVQFFGAAAPLARVIGTATSLVDIAVIILLALKPTSAYIAETAARRQG